MRGVLISCLVAAFFGSTVAASGVQRFTCVFDRHVSPETGGISRDSPLSYEFVAGPGYAFAIGRDVYPVRLVVGDEGVTFLEELPTGVVQTTTIHKSGEAVHSRHTSIFGEFVPSQYYGACEYESTE